MIKSHSARRNTPDKILQLNFLRKAEFERNKFCTQYIQRSGNRNLSNSSSHHFGSRLDSSLFSFVIILVPHCRIPVIKQGLK